MILIDSKSQQNQNRGQSVVLENLICKQLQQKACFLKGMISFKENHNDYKRKEFNNKELI